MNEEFIVIIQKEFRRGDLVRQGECERGIDFFFVKIQKRIYIFGGGGGVGSGGGGGADVNEKLKN